MTDLCEMAIAEKTQVKAVAAVRCYLDSQPFNVALPECVLALLKHHESWIRKSNGGVTAARKIRVYKSFALELVKSTGIESICWSFAVQCLMRKHKGRPKLEFKDRLKTYIGYAARATVRDQIVAARSQLGGRSGDDKDVDHTNPGGFAAILAEFIATEPAKLRPCKPDGSQYWAFTDAAATARWQVHHRLRATFQLIDKKAHIVLTQERRAMEIKVEVKVEA
jgi:hypothetical protein